MVVATGEGYKYYQLEYTDNEGVYRTSPSGVYHDEKTAIDMCNIMNTPRTITYKRQVVYPNELS